MPEQIAPLEPKVIESFSQLSFQEIALHIADGLLGEDIPRHELKRMVDHTIAFDAPLVPVEDQIFSLELFHGPTLAFKDFGARFMSQVLAYLARQQSREILILVATSGDTGSAVANGFLGTPGIRVVVLYPSGKVSDIQEKQFTTLGENITAVEVDGSFDDCQRLVKEAFLDSALREKYFLTSANSINIARLIPQSFYYCYAWSRVPKNKPVVFSVPSGNFGNLTAGLLAKRLGIPIQHFIAATNANDIVPQYLATGIFQPRPSLSTISNAMDVGNPSNFDRMRELYHPLTKEMTGYSFTDEETKAAIQKVFVERKYVLDPHGAIGYLGLKRYQHSVDFTGVFLETAHPAKFSDVVNEVLNIQIEMPDSLKTFAAKEKKTTRCSASFLQFKQLLIDRF